MTSTRPGRGRRARRLGSDVSARLAARFSPSTLALTAMAVAVVALALPWRNSHLTTGFMSTYLPGTCHLSYDGYSYCDYGSIGFGTTTTIAGPTPGFAGPIRVVAAIAAGLLFLAWRRGVRSAATAGLVLATSGLVLGGILPTSGRLVFAVSIVLIGLALRQRDLLGRQGRPTAHLGSTG